MPTNSCAVHYYMIRMLRCNATRCKQDAESEASVQKALDQLMQQGVGGTTIVLVAHRLSTVVGADSIAVMHDGQIVELGTHRELLKVSRTYLSCSWYCCEY
jgi:ABC-type multidrug transport system fused ATPase/permease subunit